MMRADFTANYQKVEVKVGSFGEGVAEAEVTLIDNGHSETLDVSFPYAGTMTADDMERAALRAAISSMEEKASLLRSELSDREARA